MLLKKEVLPLNKKIKVVLLVIGVLIGLRVLGTIMKTAPNLFALIFLVGAALSTFGVIKGGISFLHIPNRKVSLLSLAACTVMLFVSIGMMANSGNFTSEGSRGNDQSTLSKMLSGPKEKHHVYINMEYELTDSTLIAKGETNLVDGSILTTNMLAREYGLDSLGIENTALKYIKDVISDDEFEQDVIVQDGAFQITWDISNAKGILPIAYELDLEFYHYPQEDPSINHSQPQNVLEVYGEDFLLLTGPQIKEIRPPEAFKKKNKNSFEARDRNELVIRHLIIWEGEQLIIEDTNN